MKRILSILLSAVIMALPCAPLAGCSGSLLDTVLADLPIATDIAISVVTIASSGNAANVQQVTEYAGKVSADLKLLESLITQYKSNLAGAPPATIAQANAALNDVQSNLAAIMTAVGVNDPKVTAAVAAAVGSVKLILNDVALLIQNSAPKAVSAQLFFGLGMPGVDFLGIGSQAKIQPGAAGPQKPSGKTARQIAKDYNQKIAKDFPKAKVNIPRIHVLGIPMP
jgi:hypothetical protein